MARYVVRDGTVMIGGVGYGAGAVIELDAAEGDALCHGPRPVLEPASASAPASAPLAAAIKKKAPPRKKAAAKRST